MSCSHWCLARITVRNITLNLRQNEKAIGLILSYLIYKPKSVMDHEKLRFSLKITKHKAMMNGFNQIICS